MGHLNDEVTIWYPNSIRVWILIQLGSHPDCPFTRVYNINIGQIRFHRIEYIWIQGQMGSNKDYKEVRSEENESRVFIFHLSLFIFSLKERLFDDRFRIFTFGFSFITTSICISLRISPNSFAWNKQGICIFT